MLDFSDAHVLCIQFLFLRYNNLQKVISFIKKKKVMENT